MDRLDRRKFLTMLGCSAAAWPMMTPMTFAALPSDNRLVVVILRGAMDGLDALQPYGDPALRDPAAGVRHRAGAGGDRSDRLPRAAPGADPVGAVVAGRRSWLCAGRQHAVPRRAQPLRRAGYSGGRHGGAGAADGRTGWLAQSPSAADARGARADRLRRRARRNADPARWGRSFQLGPGCAAGHVPGDGGSVAAHLSRRSAVPRQRRSRSGPVGRRAGGRQGRTKRCSPSPQIS